MAEFALVIEGALSEFRTYDERPPDIPHKKVEWFPVLREYGEPFEGVENDAYVIRTVDPATLPPPVPQSVSPRQARLALLAAGKLDAANAAVDQAGGATKVAWEYATEVRRDDDGVVLLAAAIGLGSDDLDRLFTEAANI